MSQAHKMISTKTTALLAALSVVAATTGAVVIPAAFAANANNQPQLYSTNQDARVLNFGLSAATNDVGGDFSGGNDAETQTNNFNFIDQDSTTTQTNTNTAISGCTFSAFVTSC